MKKVLLTVIMLLVVVMATLAFASCGKGDSDNGSVSVSGSGESAGRSDSTSGSGISGVRSILSASFKETGELILVFSDESTVNLGIVNDKNKAGAGDRAISSSRANEKKELIISFTDGSSVNLGVVGWYDKYVVTINYVDGELRFSYNDGVLTGVIIVSGSDSVCKHKNIKYNEQVAHKMNTDGTFENGVYLMFCPDCGYTKTISGVMHSVEKTTYEPTCTKEGYTLPKCKVCGFEFEKENVVDALGHDYVLHPVVGATSSEMKKWCEEGGLSVKICARCNAIGESFTISEENARGHHSDKWSLTKNPTWDNVGILSGVCNVCGNVVERSIPACSDKAYTVSNITPENVPCSAEKKGDFEIKIDGQKIKVENVSIPGGLHVFRGREIDDSKVMVFETIADLNVSGFKLFSNVKYLNCFEISSAYFECDKCANVIVINVRKRHASADSSKDIILKMPTCESDGVIRIYCATCECEKEEVIPAVGHDYGSFVWDKDKSAMVGICRNVINGNVSECEKPYIVYDNIKKYETKITEAATCRKRGVMQYTLYFNDGTVEFVNVDIPELDHVLMRADGTTERISDAAEKKYHMSFYPEIKPFGNAVVSCAAPFGGHFTCEECKEEIAVTLYKPHTIKDGTVVTHPATCVNPGTRDYTCAVCEGEAANIFDEKYENALGHDYQWVILNKSESEDGKYHLIATCQRERENAQGVSELCLEDGCRLDYLSVKPIKCEVVLIPTCVREGFNRYTITTEDGSTKVINATISRIMHKLNGEYIDYNKPVPSTKKGIKYFGNSNVSLACDGDGVFGYFTCDECSEIVSIKIKKPHARPSDIPEENRVAATCDNYGYVSYVCESCKKAAIDLIEPLNHSLSVTATYESGDLKIKIACDRDGCGYENITVVENVKFNEKEFNFNVVTKEAASCVKEGLTIYSFTLKDYKYSVVRGKVTETVSAEGNKQLQVENSGVDTIFVDLAGTVTLVTARLDHNYIKTEKLDESGNVVVGADGKPVMIDKIFTFEVVEGTGATARTYVVQSKVCKDCGNSVEIGRYEKPAD